MSNRRDLIAGLLGAAGAAAVGQVPGQAQAAPGLSDADVERIITIVEARLEAKRGEEDRLATLLKLHKEGLLSRETLLAEFGVEDKPPLIEAYLTRAGYLPGGALRGFTIGGSAVILPGLAATGGFW